MKGTNNASREKVYRPEKKRKDFSMVLMMVLAAILLLLTFGCAVYEIAVWIRENIWFRQEETVLPEDEPTEGVARVEGAVYIRYLSAPEDDTEYHTIEEYREGDGPAPEWYRPDEPMSAEWEDHFRDATKMVDDVTDINVGDKNVLCKDAGCPDWNIDSSIYGWDGRRAEVWELDLLSRIFYLEFWGSSDMLCEAGIDAILRLWESGDHGRTLGEVLSAVNEQGDFVFSTYPEVWSTEYDADGLAWCRAYTEERFIAGPVWIAPYFRLDHYHDTKWSVPAYQIDNVFFSVGKEW